MAKPRKVHTVESLLERTVEEGQCYLWQGYKANGVPMVDRDGKMVSVRRLIAELQGREVKRGYYVASCGCTDCVAPNHILYRHPNQHMKAMAETEFTVERRIRMIQATRKRPNVRLSIEIAREIRAAEGSYREIGERYGISKSCVGHIRRGDYWPEISSPFAGLML